MTTTEEVWADLDEEVDKELAASRAAAEARAAWQRELDRRIAAAMAEAAVAATFHELQQRARDFETIAAVFEWVGAPAPAGESLPVHIFRVAVLEATGREAA